MGSKVDNRTTHSWSFADGDTAIVCEFYGPGIECKAKPLGGMDVYLDGRLIAFVHAPNKEVQNFFEVSNVVDKDPLIGR